MIFKQWEVWIILWWQMSTRWRLGYCAAMYETTFVWHSPNITELDVIGEGRTRGWPRPHGPGGPGNSLWQPAVSRIIDDHCHSHGTLEMCGSRKFPLRATIRSTDPKPVGGLWGTVTADMLYAINTMTQKSPISRSTNLHSLKKTRQEFNSELQDDEQNSYRNAKKCGTNNKIQQRVTR